MHPPGWYLALRYMHGTGLVARAGAKIEAERRGAQFVFADRVLCAAKDWRAVLEDWWNALAEGGCLILWLPDCRYQEPEPFEARVTLYDLSHALDHRAGWQLHESDLIDGYAYLVWQKRSDKKRLRTPWCKQPKHLLIARTGAYGDALMASSVLPWLKEQGWTISFISRHQGCEILRFDPHIDELILLAAGQASDDELPNYWRAWEKRFDRFINLAFSVEGELLKQPMRGDYFWSDSQRRALCNRSYLRHLHDLAEVPGPYRIRFYPSADETDWASAKANEYGKFVLWCLRGSAVHKWWPYGPQAICRLLASTDLNFVLTGDAGTQNLAQNIREAVATYHGDTSRVHNLTGTHSIRDIATLAHHAAVVVGPETGIMNAVSMQPMPKVLLLSHSSAKNLSDDWIMTTALAPTSPCYPCHRLHLNHDWCPEDERTGAAACAASISPESVVREVAKARRRKISSP